MPGPMVDPNLLPVEEALAEVTFPIAKRELIEQIDGRTVLFDGRNVDLHELIKDLHDDWFESEDELHAALRDAYPHVEEDEAAAHAVASRERAWNAPEAGGERGAADTPSYGDVRP